MRDVKKSWTILIYANGNNEFEPEMYQSVLAAEKIGSSKSVNVLVQLGRMERTLAKILRPSDVLTDTGDTWTGVRRYYVTKNTGNSRENLSSPVIKDLGFQNMADPKVLYEFITWGMENYPAKKFMLILGGHSFEYLGTLTDYSQNLPYIMGIPEMCKALSLVQKTKGIGIDLLVLDTCYMNMVEILYELAKEKSHTVKNVLTYIEYGPIAGLPLDKLISIVEKNHNLVDLNLLVKNIIEGINLDLVAFNINYKKLEKIKRTANDLAQLLLKTEQRSTINLSQLLEINDGSDPLLSYVKDLKKSLLSLIIYSQRITNFKSNLIDIAHKTTGNKLAVCYLKLGFANNNHWPKLLGKLFWEESRTLEEGRQLKPTILPFQALVTLISIMNPNAEQEQLEKIVRRLLEYKKWEQHTNFKLR